MNALPRARKKDDPLLAGDDKGYLEEAVGKLLGCDKAYVQANQVMRRMFRIDLDSEWRCEEDLRGAIELVVHDKKLACLPHIVVWDRGGGVYHPHLWFLLPYEAAVWFAPGNRHCRRGNMALFRRVVMGIAKALIHLGADPTACGLSGKGKNAECPLMNYAVWNRDQFPTLHEHADYVDTSRQADAGRLAREAMARSTGMPLKLSNQAFEEIQDMCWESLNRMRSAGDPEYLRFLYDRAALAELLQLRIRAAVESSATSSKDLRIRLKQMGKVCRHYAATWKHDITRNGKVINRGVCCDRTEGLDVKGRQAEGARYVNERRSSSTRQRIAEAIALIEASGAEATQADVARSTGLGKSTVSRQWAYAALPTRAPCVLHPVVDPQLTLKSSTVDQPSPFTDDVTPSCSEAASPSLPASTMETSTVTDDTQPSTEAATQCTESSRTAPSSSRTVSPIRRPFLIVASHVQNPEERQMPHAVMKLYRQRTSSSPGKPLITNRPTNLGVTSSGPASPLPSTPASTATETRDIPQPFRYAFVPLSKSHAVEEAQAVQEAAPVDDRPDTAGVAPFLRATSVETVDAKDDAQPSREAPVKAFRPSQTVVVPSVRRHYLPKSQRFPVGSWRERGKRFPGPDCLDDEIPCEAEFAA